MNKLPPIAKVYEALSAVADQRVEMHADHAIVTSSDHTKDYTVKFLPDGYSSNDNATLWQHYPGYPILAVMIIQGKLKSNPECLPWFQAVNWKQLKTQAKNDYDKAISVFLQSFSKTIQNQIVDEVQNLFDQLSSMEITVKGNRAPRSQESRTK